MPKLFISYRRDDTAGVAGRIYDRLHSHFGPGSVFMDVDSIPPGVDFRERLAADVGACDVVLALIGERWAGAGPDGTRRLNDPGDFVRCEIEAALATGIPVLPILVGKVPMPREEQLPPPLRPLAYRNACTVDPGQDFHGHMDRLVRGLQQLLPPTTDVPPAVPPGTATTGSVATPPSRRGHLLRLVAAAATLLLLAAAAVWVVRATWHAPSGGTAQQPNPTAPPLSPEQVTRDPDGVPLRRDFPIAVELVGARRDGDRVLHMNEGQLLALRIQVPVTCWVGVWYENEDGKVTMLFPNDFETDHLARAGEPRLIPGNDSYMIPARRGDAPGRLRVLASTERWNPARGRKVGPFVVYETPDELEQFRNFDVVPKTAGSAKVSEVAFPVKVDPPQER